MVRLRREVIPLPAVEFGASRLAVLRRLVVAGQRLLLLVAGVVHLLLMLLGRREARRKVPVQRHLVRLRVRGLPRLLRFPPEQERGDKGGDADDSHADADADADLGALGYPLVLGIWVGRARCRGRCLRC